MEQRKRHVISRKDAFKAQSWLNHNWETLKKMTLDQAANALAGHIGHPISAHALRGLFNDMGKKFPGKLPDRKVLTDEQRTGVQHRRMLTRQVGKLAKQVELLFAKLGEDIPSELQIDIDYLIRAGRGGGIEEGNNNAGNDAERT